MKFDTVLNNHFFSQSGLEQSNSEVEAFDSFSQNSDNKFGNSSGQKFNNRTKRLLEIGRIDEFVTFFRKLLTNRNNLDVDYLAVWVEKT